MVLGIKPTQLTRVGYTYQDLVCIKVLIDWFRDPDIYEWVTLEFAGGDLKLKGLDDVVALNMHGRYELTQVKFTIDPDRNDLALSFDWLLKKKKKGTSFLQKWAIDIVKYSSSGEIESAELITNRKPDKEIMACIVDGKIDIGSIPPLKMKIIEDQLGSKEVIKTVFGLLAFRHSQLSIDDFENKLKDSLVPDHTNNEGWLSFLKSVERWATRKNEPSEQGQIQYKHLEEALADRNARVLPQFFDVPVGYIPPTESFHSSIVEKTNSPGCWVVSGMPGKGKSTYLSYLYNDLMEKGARVVRHHYYLSSASLGDRVSYENISQSLISQIRELFPSLTQNSESNDLSNWVGLAATAALAEGRPLVLILDGLDHVSRERNDISQLNHLINRIMPFKDRLTLILGTQPVSSAHLPNKLNALNPIDGHWVDLPHMDLSAIKSWVSGLVQNGVVEINAAGEVDDELAELSESFQQISHGYPLHLIYSLNSLILRKKFLRSYEIRALPACPAGDIQNYYSRLWGSLSVSAQDVLMLIASVDFVWPDKESLGCCFKDSLLFSQSFDEVVHLLEQKRSGLYPFHGSILVFLRGLDQYKSSKLTILKKAQSWLNARDASISTSGWSWVVEGQLGNPIPLLENLTHDWMIDSFLDGCPVQHIEHVFSIGERFALEKQDYPSLVRLRLNKIRILNGPEFQLQNYAEFVYLTLQDRPETYSLAWRADNLSQLEIEEVVVVSILYNAIDPKVSERCLAELWRRLRFYSRLDGRHHNEKIERLVSGVIKTMASFETLDLDGILEFLDRVSDKHRFFIQLLDVLVEFDHAAKILEIKASKIPEGAESRFWEVFISICLTNEIDIMKRPELGVISESPLGQLVCLRNGQPVDLPAKVHFKLPESYDEASATYFYQLFISNLLEQTVRPHKLDKPKCSDSVKETDFLANVCFGFKSLATQVATKHSLGDQISLLDIYQTFDIEQPSTHKYRLSPASHSITRALCRVVTAICILHGDKFNLEQKEVEKLDELEWWNSGIWLQLMAKEKDSPLNSRVLQHFAEEAYYNLSKREEDTAMLANEALELAGQVVSLDGKPHFNDFLRLAALNTLGYGHRKDTTFSELFEAFRECANHNTGDLPNWLKRTAPFVRSMFEFTEREIRHIPGWYLGLAGEYVSAQLVNEFRFHLDNENWFIANEVLKAITLKFPLNSEEERCLIRSFTSHDAMSSLETRAEMNSGIKELYEDQIKFLGGMPPTPRESHSSADDKKVTDIDHADFSPAQLVDLLNALDDAGVFNVEEYINEWVIHWNKEGRAIDIINAFEAEWSNATKDRKLKDCLHAIFLLSKQVQGDKAAYKWAVRDTLHNDHWVRWSGTRAHKKLICYGANFKTKWNEFLVDTLGAVSSDLKKQDRVIVPTAELVSYLLAAEQTSLAVQVVEEMCLALEAEISHLPIPEIEWEERCHDFDQIASELLLDYFRWPDRLGRLRTANQMANLLITKPQFRKLYLDHLKKQSYEIQVADLLAVLQLTGPDLFSSDQLEQAIKYPSILSDHLMSVIGYNESKRTPTLEYSTTLNERDYSYSDSYEKSKNGMAPIYFHAIDDLGKRYDYPLGAHMSAEWEMISARKEIIYPSAHRFCGDQFYSQDRILCSLSFQAEGAVLSAYLRTLAFAATKLSVPVEEVVAMTPDAAAFCGYLSQLTPTQKPSDWPKIGKFGKDDSLPKQNNFEEYLEQIVIDRDLLLRASGPVLRDYSGVSIDLDIAAVLVGASGCTDAKIIYETFVEGHKNQLVHDVSPLSKRHFPVAGRWEIDLLMRGFDKPNFAVGSYGLPEREVTEGSIIYTMGGTLNAEWKYWTDCWYPARHYSMGPSLGTFLKMPADTTRDLIENTHEKIYHVARLTVIDKREYGNADEPEELYAIRRYMQPVRW